MTDFCLKTPLKTGDYFTAVRLTVGGLCAQAGLDMDAAEDFKVCVTESMLILKRNGFGAAELVFSLDGGLCARVSGFEPGEKEEAGCEDDISYALLGALIEDVRFEKENGATSAVLLKKSV